VIGTQQSWNRLNFVKTPRIKKLRRKLISFQARVAQPPSAVYRMIHGGPQPRSLCMICCGPQAPLPAQDRAVCLCSLREWKSLLVIKIALIKIAPSAGGATTS
jgi:hypothetical protein